MKFLTLHQPWASLVALGVKTIETRSWSTVYRGPLAIHAAAQAPIGGDLGEWHCSRYADGSARLWRRPGDSYPLPLRSIVAVCDLVDVVPIAVAAAVINRPLAPAPPYVVDTRHLGGALCLLTPQNAPGGDDIEDQRPYGDYRIRRWAWLLEDIRPLPEPILMPGAQGLRDLPPEVDDHLTRFHRCGNAEASHA